MSRAEEFGQGFDPETGRPRMYHGTANDIGYHGVVIPSSALSHRSKWKEFYVGDEAWRKDRVFTSQRERSAWQWGQGPGRLRVHEVHVQDPRGGNEGEWHGESAMVKDTHWTPPPPLGPQDRRTGERKPSNAWVQGTLPPHDWGVGKNWTHSEDWPQPAEPQRNLHSQQFAGQGKLFG